MLLYHTGFASGSTFDAIKAFSILAVLASAGCVAVSVLSMFSKSVKWMMPFFAAIGAGVCGAIAMAIFTNEYNSSSDDYGWSYFSGWVGTGLAFVTSCIAFATKNNYESI